MCHPVFCPSLDIITLIPQPFKRFMCTQQCKFVFRRLRESHLLAPSGRRSKGSHNLSDRNLHFRVELSDISHHISLCTCRAPWGCRSTRRDNRELCRVWVLNAQRLACAMTRSGTPRAGSLPLALGRSSAGNSGRSLSSLGSCGPLPVRPAINMDLYLRPSHTAQLVTL